MLKFKKSVILVLLLSTGFLATGCYGSFALTKKVYNWNGTLGNKWMNSIVFFGLTYIIPVYGFAGFVDGVVLNTIEFWTGSNPLAMADGQKETKYVTDAGKTYQITASKNQFEITQVAGPNAGESATLAFNQETSVWNITNGSESVDLLKVVQINGDTAVEAFLPDGSVELIK